MKRIATHNGSFHADDVFAVATLKLALNESVSVFRTRDKDAIKQADIAVDVGAEYNPDQDKFDHHQEGGAGERDNGIPYASFGLVWKKYGPLLCENQDVAEIIDNKLVAPIDAIDNGVELTSGDNRFDGVYPYSISSLINSFRPTWQEDTDRSETFQSLTKLASGIINREITHAQAVNDAKDMVRQAYENADDKRIITLEDDLPWQGVLTQEYEPLFVVYPKPDKGEWRLRAVPNNGFDNRKDLPAEWAGKEGEELQAATGVSDAIFAHRGQFVVVLGSKESALKLAHEVIS